MIAAKTVKTNFPLCCEKLQWVMYNHYTIQKSLIDITY